MRCDFCSCETGNNKKACKKCKKKIKNNYSKIKGFDMLRENLRKNSINFKKGFKCNIYASHYYNQSWSKKMNNVSGTPKQGYKSNG